MKKYKDNLSKKFIYWRKKIIITSFFSYILYYFTRKSFIFIIPALSEEIQLTNSEIGLLSTTLYITYGISKIINSFLADILNPRYFIAIGLLMSGICNTCFVYSKTINILLFFCCLNGWFQGLGWPAITKQLTHWYNGKERSLWWSICSTAHTIGGALAALICAHLIYIYNWHYAIYFPSILSILFSFFVINCIKKAPNILNTSLLNNKKLNKETIFLYFKEILTNKIIILFSITYFFTYLIKTAINDWIILFFIEQKIHTLTEASLCIFCFEIGGFIGILISGILTTTNIQKNKIRILIIYFTILIITVFSLYISISQNLLIDMLILTIIGFVIFGPQLIIGLLVSEITHKKNTCTANGFISMWAYVGAAFAGYPLGVIIDTSWYLFFYVILVCAFISIYLLVIIFKNTKN